MPCHEHGASGPYEGHVSTSRSENPCDRWSGYESYVNITHNMCRNHGDTIPWCFVNGLKEYCHVNPCQQECYEGRGEDYYGRVSQSITGKRCLAWNSVTLRYSNVDHAYCRNFEDDLAAPWCYVDHQNTRELCAIPMCRRTGKRRCSFIIYVNKLKTIECFNYFKSISNPAIPCRRCILIIPY